MESRITSLIDELIAALPPDSLVTVPASMDAYRWDRARDPDAGMPIGVVRARSTQDVQTAIRIAASHMVPVVPRGAGSGLSGGSSAVQGGLVISLDRMRDIQIHAATRMAT